MRPRTLPQNNRFHGLCTQLDLDHQEKGQLVSQFTNGREISSSKMNFYEMENCIKHLESMVGKKDDPLDKQRKKIIHYFHELGWKKTDGSADMLQIEGWMMHKSYLKKSMNDYSANELPKLVSQVEMMYKKHLNSI